MSGRTSVADLIDLARSSGVRLDAIFQFDEIPEKLPPGNYIFNLHPPDSYNGHWTAAQVPSVYFDSFGVRPPHQVSKHMDANFIHNRKQIQGFNTNWCGQYCIAFLYAMQHGSGSDRDKLARYVDQFKAVSIF